MTAFPAWQINPRGAEQIRGRLRAARAASASNLGFQLDLRLYRNDTCTYVVSTFVHADAQGAALMKVSSRRVEPLPPGAPGVLDDDAGFEELTGRNLPFAEAARALHDALSGERWKLLRVLDAEKAKALLPDPRLQRVALDDLAQVRARLEAAARGLAESKANRVRVRVDDQVFLVRDAAGALLGRLTADFDSPPGGRLAFRLKEYKPFGY